MLPLLEVLHGSNNGASVGLHSSSVNSFGKYFESFALPSSTAHQPTSLLRRSSTTIGVASQDKGRPLHQKCRPTHPKLSTVRPLDNRGKGGRRVPEEQPPPQWRRPCRVHAGHRRDRRRRPGPRHRTNRPGHHAAGGDVPFDLLPALLGRTRDREAVGDSGEGVHGAGPAGGGGRGHAAATDRGAARAGVRVRAGRAPEEGADESGCTPGSVPAGPRGPAGDGHPSRTGVATGLVRSTRGLGRAALDRPRRALFTAPLLTLLRVGFT